MKDYVAENSCRSIQKRKMKQSVTVAHRRSKDIQNWRSSDFADFFKLVGVSICVKKKEDLRQRYELVVSFLKYLASGESLEEPTEGFDDLDRRDPDSPPPLKRVTSAA